jgi:lipopolysaccharide transport system ATP-binding protein
MATRPAIRVTDLRKRFRIGRAPVGLRETLATAARSFAGALSGSRPPAPHVWALEGVTFDIDEGSVVGVIGRNGAGKSTLLKILTRITPPTSGRAEIHGRIGSLLEVGTGFHPELTGRENVLLNGAILGMRRAEVLRKLDAIVDFAGVSTFLDTPVKHYSSGMYMRLAFAVAAHLDADVLLIDEVLAVGDLEFQRKCLSKVNEATRSGRTALIVSHQLNLVRNACDRVLWLSEGRVREFGPTAAVVAAYERDALEVGAAADHSRRTGFRAWSVATATDAPARHESDAVLEPVEFAFTIHVARPIDRGTFTASLHDESGQLVWGCDPQLPSTPAGTHELRLWVAALPLRPGSYRWRVCLYDGEGLVDEWHAVPTLAITSRPQSHSRDKWAGVVNVPCRVSLRESTLQRSAENAEPTA